MTRRMLLLGAISFIGLIVVTQIQAQSPLASESAVAIEYSEENIDQQRQLLRQLYREQIQSYQNTQRKFSLAKAQFQKLETLASLEEAVTSTREVYVARDAVLVTYLDQLFLELRVSPSYDDEIKQLYLNKISQLKNDLLVFDQLVVNSQDRQAMAERAAGFLPLGKELQTVSYQTRKLLYLGNFRASAGLAQQLTQEVKDYHQQNPVSALKQGERQRAYQELNSANAVVQSAWDKSVHEFQSQKDFTSQAYTAFIATLSPIQSGLIRWYGLLEQTMAL